MADRRVKIRFYAALKRRVGDPPWTGGTIPVEWLLHGAPVAFDSATGEVKPVKTAGLAALTCGDGGTAYLVDPDADADDADPDVLFADLLEQSEDFVHLRLWRVRRSALPSRHDFADGTTTPIELAKTQGIAEATDLVLFPRSCVVGWLVNRVGPSQRNVLRYLEIQTGVSMKLVILPRADALDLVRGELVTAIDVEVAAGHFEALANVAPELGEASKNVKTPGLRTIRVSFSAEKKHRQAFWQWWRPHAKQLVSLGSQEVERIEVTQAGFEDLPAQVVDLLAQAIGIEATIPLATGRTVESDAAREAIIGGFNRYNELIARAADGLDAIAENQRVERRRRS